MAESHYLDGWIVCGHCRQRSAATADVMAPFRWLAQHVCGTAKAS